MSGPNLVNQYPITSLPRVNDVELSRKLVVSPIISHDTSIIDLGISKSMISSHLIKPSPKLLWSYALKPSVVVEAMDVVKSSNKKYYICSLSERRSAQLLLVETENDTTITTTTTTTTGGDGNFNISTSKESKLKLHQKAIGVKFLSVSKIAVVYVDGAVEIINLVENVLSFAGNKIASSSEKEEEVIFNTFISDLEQPLLLIVSKVLRSKKLNYKLISLDLQKPIFEAQMVQRDYQKEKEEEKAAEENFVFAYIEGTLFQYRNFHLESISIANFQTQNTILVSTLIDKQFPVSIRAPAPDRILLGNADMIYLINVKFGALLSKFKSVSSSSNPVADIVYVNQVIPVKGQSQNTSNSVGFYLNLKNKDKNLYLNVIDINVGFNKLNECLGKALEKPKEKKLHNLVELYDDDDDDDDGDGTVNGGHSIEKTNSELDEVYESLKEAQQAGDLHKWESILIPYLKNNKSWQDIKKNGDKQSKKNKVYQYKEFEVENDRVVDVKFIESLFELLFDTNPLSFKNSAFVPEYTLMYLLTNPIYPKLYAKGLIQLLDETKNKTLLRQAINTCLNIPLDDFLQQLLREKDATVIHDLINRVVLEFSTDKITTVLKKVIDGQDHSVDVIELINKLLASKTANNWILIEILISINGLFNWSEDDLKRLNRLVDISLKALEVNAYNLTLVKQIQLKKNQLAQIHNGKKSKNEINSSTSGLGLLSITDQTSLGNKKVDSLVNSKVPLYSIETLDV
ncbi:UTP8 [Candida oxycetoniae]|uniref:UTP8 n=1 Tax=Candida oxycetoniae TaxID=497107 RepID=A0AAI9WW29_9ASCO|nr:UTP8 [Candida oxycetoniae]KAI3402602.2 UTP8 [Candida oxycetoniae]